MNIQQTIADLEKQAAQYTEAANTLRALLDGAPAPDEPTEQPSTQQRARRAKGSTGTKGSKKASKRTVSPETRAKMAEAAKAHFQKKREAQGQEESGNEAGNGWRRWLSFSSACSSRAIHRLL